MGLEEKQQSGKSILRDFDPGDGLGDVFRGGTQVFEEDVSQSGTLRCVGSRAAVPVQYIEKVADVERRDATVRILFSGITVGEKWISELFFHVLKLAPDVFPVGIAGKDRASAGDCLVRKTLCERPLETVLEPS